MATDAAFDADGIIACIYVFGGGLSMLLCLLVLFCFAGTPAISRFPASMMGWRLVCDTILSAPARSSSLSLLPLLLSEPFRRACSPTHTR